MAAGEWGRLRCCGLCGASFAEMLGSPRRWRGSNQRRFHPPRCCRHHHRSRATWWGVACTQCWTEAIRETEAEAEEVIARRNPPRHGDVSSQHCGSTMLEGAKRAGWGKRGAAMQGVGQSHWIVEGWREAAVLEIGQGLAKEAARRRCTRGREGASSKSMLRSSLVMATWLVAR